MTRPLARKGRARPPVSLAHDYLTQRGGAERVALLLADTFPQATMHTALYAPNLTFPEFRRVAVDPLALNGLWPLRTHHRWALPLLAPSFSATVVDAEVLVASSSGWAHGLPTTGRKVVYCHAPARWLYQRDRYLGGKGRNRAAAVGLDLLAGPLRGWDARGAATVDRYLANSTVTRDAIRSVYDRDAEIVPPPPALVEGGPEKPIEGVGSGFALCVARLLPYKNVDVVIEAAVRGGTELVVVGSGPEQARLAALAAERPGIRLLGRVTDAELRWLYRHCAVLVAASHEDYGLSPLEAASFGRPSVVLRGGGYLDTVVEGETGMFFDQPAPALLVAALREALRHPWDEALLVKHAASFSGETFADRLRQVVEQERSALQ